MGHLLGYKLGETGAQQHRTIRRRAHASSPLLRSAQGADEDGDAKVAGSTASCYKVAASTSLMNGSFQQSGAQYRPQIVGMAPHNNDPPIL